MHSGASQPLAHPLGPLLQSIRHGSHTVALGTLKPRPTTDFFMETPTDTDQPWKKWHRNNTICVWHYIQMWSLLLLLHLHTVIDDLFWRTDQNDVMVWQWLDVCRKWHFGHGHFESCCGWGVGTHMQIGVYAWWREWPQYSICEVLFATSVLVLIFARCTWNSDMILCFRYLNVSALEEYFAGKDNVDDIKKAALDVRLLALNSFLMLFIMK